MNNEKYAYTMVRNIPKTELIVYILNSKLISLSSRVIIECRIKIENYLDVNEQSCQKQIPT